MKGLIADVNAKYAVMLSENGEFITIRNKNYSIGQKISYRKTSYYKLAAMAACLILVFIMGGIGTKTYYTPVSYVDIEINPSVRLEINSCQKVIKTIALNEDAEDLLSKTRKVGGDVQKCINEIIVKSEEIGYLNESNKDVSVYVVSDAEELIEYMDECQNSYSGELNVTVSKNSFAEYTKAKELNVSVGKLIEIETYTDKFGGTLEENAVLLSDKSKSEIQLLNESENSKTDSNNELVADKDKTIQNIDDSNNTESDENYPIVTEFPKTVVNSTPKENVNPTKAPVVFSASTEKITAIPTMGPVAVVTKMPTAEPTKAPTSTPVPTETSTPVPTETSTPVPTETSTPVPTQTSTPVPTQTPTPVPVQTSTPVPTQTATPVPTETSTPVPTETATPVPTQTTTPGPTTKPDYPDYPWWPPFFWPILGDLLGW